MMNRRGELLLLMKERNFEIQARLILSNLYRTHRVNQGLKVALVTSTKARKNKSLCQIIVKLIAKEIDRLEDKVIRVIHKRNQKKAKIKVENRSLKINLSFLRA